MEEYVRLGTIVKTFGLKGEVRVYSLTDYAEERFQKGRKLTLLSPDEKKRVPVTVASFRDGGGFYFVSFEEISSIEEAEAYRGWHIEIAKEDAPLPPGYVRFQDMLGCQVLNDETGELLGLVSGIESYAPTKNLVVEREKGEPFSVPFAPTFIANVDVEKKQIRIHVVEGLL